MGITLVYALDIFDLRIPIINIMATDHLYDDYYMYTTEDYTYFMKNKIGLYNAETILYVLNGHNIYMLNKYFNEDRNCEYVKYNMKNHKGYSTTNLEKFIKILPKNSEDKFRNEVKLHCRQ